MNSMWDQFVSKITRGIFRVIQRVRPSTLGPLPKNPRLILVFSTTGIGDALFNTGAIRSLKLAYPGARIAVCAHRKRQTVARHHPDVDEVVPYGKSPWYFWKILLRFRWKKPDLVVLLSVNPEVVFLAYCINRRALFGGERHCGSHAFLLSRTVPAPKGHIMLRFSRIAEAAGAAGVLQPMVYRPLASETAGVKARFAQWIGAPFVVFQTGGGRTLSWRNWPVESYIRTIRWVRETYGLPVVLTGGRDNEAVATAIEQACPGAVNLCSKTSLEETAAILTLAAMLVSSDTGVMHLGFAVGCPTLAVLHYRSGAGAVGPCDFSAGHEVVELSAPGDPGTDSRTMADIPDEEIRGAIRRILARRGIAPVA
jgi:ADP-heptose:LPS heptosyltransferase